VFSLTIDFHPRFILHDEVTGNERNYTDPFLLKVIGGGANMSSITYFDRDDIYRFNPGNGFDLCGNNADRGQ
jgi:hypothetical protein